MDPLNGLTSPLRDKAEVDAVTGEVHHVIVTGLAAAQHGAGGVLVEESAV